MDFQQLQKKVFTTLANVDVAHQAHSHGALVTETVDGRVFIDSVESEFDSISEAVQYLSNRKVQQEIVESIAADICSEMSPIMIAETIRKHHGNIRISDELVESYIDLVESKRFTVDPVAIEMNSWVPHTSLLEDRVEFVLNDQTKVVVSEQTVHLINKVLGQHQDVLDYMRESADNFVEVVSLLGEHE